MLWRLGVLTVVGALVVLPLAPSAYAAGSSAATARDKAQSSAARLHGLEQRLRTAVAAYGAALDGLQQQVAAGVDAQDAVTSGTAGLQAATDERTQRIRALYMDGGQLGIYASLMSAHSPQDLALRVMAARSVVSDSDQAVVTAQLAYAQAAQDQVAADRQVSAAVVSADDVTARADAVNRLVVQARAVTAHLSARARSLARAELAAEAASAASAEHRAAGSVSAMAIPATYLTLYQAAARTCHGLDWTLLAAVGQIESGHGRNDGPSSAGAVGPMQFRPRTFEAFAVDGNHDGRLDPWNPADAIFTAAHFLCSYGAGNPGRRRRSIVALQQCPVVRRPGAGHPGQDRRRVLTGSTGGPGRSGYRRNP